LSVADRARPVTGASSFILDEAEEIILKKK
jgi:hypothetical protein